MPYPNEHACRIAPPGDFQAGSFRRVARTVKGKGAAMIFGRKPGETKATLQAIRFPKGKWSAADARKVCGGLGGTFEAAVAKSADNDGGFRQIVATLQRVAKRWAGMHDNELRSAVQSALRGRGLADHDDGPWVRYLFEDHAIVGGVKDGDQRFWRIDIDESNGELELGEPVEVEETFEPVKSAVVKSVDEERFVLGPVLQPGEPDLQCEEMTAVEIAKAQRRWVRLGSELEREHTGGDLGARVTVIENYIAPQDLEFAQADGTSEVVKAGTWMLGVHVPDDKLWADVKAGRLTGFSPRGIGTRKVVVASG